MEEIFQKVIANDFAEVAGLTASASIPMSESLINDILMVALRGDETVQSCQVSIHEQNQVFVRLKTSLWPWPLNLNLKLDKFVDFASFSSPKLRMWLENHRLLGSLGSFLNVLPGWSRLYRSQVVINLAYFLHAPEQRRLLTLVRSVEIRTEDGKAIVRVEMRAG